MPRRLVRYVLLVTLAATVAACSSAQHGVGSDRAPASTAAPTTAASTLPPSPSTSRTPAPSTSSRTPTPSTSATSGHATSPRPKAHRSAANAAALPLSYSTGSATQVITVTAHSTSSTQAIVQAWARSGSGWTRVGPAVSGYIGSDGMSEHASESWSATPMGRFTLTQAFGHDSDPGTALPYLRTDDADWWISQSGPLYNTHQHCASNCPFTQGAPNEHLAHELPFYDYAVVIDYNTANAPGGVRQGAGSAIFLHVHPAGSGPTAGCVAVPEDQMIRLLRWLTPAAHPRILIGTD